MSYTVAITSQNQIYLPVEVRRRFPTGIYDYAEVTVSGQDIIVTPVPDLLSIGGTLKTKNRFTAKEEKDAFAKSFGANK
jgi:bifunctional DNA-binding transcriptional regulator/antitoxin component of YhaV-PrlF toxin-antitoxin module